ncbi:MAG: hypothetical protein AB8G96_08975 [Phycisphaerales bacterium]
MKSRLLDATLPGLGWVLSGAILVALLPLLADTLQGGRGVNPTARDAGAVWLTPHRSGSKQILLRTDAKRWSGGQYSGVVQFADAGDFSGIDPEATSSRRMVRSQVEATRGPLMHWTEAAATRRADDVPPLSQNQFHLIASGWPKRSVVGVLWDPPADGRVQLVVDGNQVERAATDRLIVAPDSHGAVPWRIVPMGMLANLAVGALAGGIFGSFIGSARRSARSASGRCVECGSGVDPSGASGGGARPIAPLSRSRTFAAASLVLASVVVVAIFGPSLISAGTPAGPGAAAITRLDPIAPNGLLARDGAAPVRSADTAGPGAYAETASLFSAGMVIGAPMLDALGDAERVEAWFADPEDVVVFDVPAIERIEEAVRDRMLAAGAAAQAVSLSIPSMLDVDWPDPLPPAIKLRFGPGVHVLGDDAMTVLSGRTSLILEGAGRDETLLYISPKSGGGGQATHGIHGTAVVVRGATVDLGADTGFDIVMRAPAPLIRLEQCRVIGLSGVFGGLLSQPGGVLSATETEFLDGFGRRGPLGRPIALFRDIGLGGFVQLHQCHFDSKFNALYSRGAPLGRTSGTVIDECSFVAPDPAFVALLEQGGPALVIRESTFEAEAEAKTEAGAGARRRPGGGDRTRASLNPAWESVDRLRDPGFSQRMLREQAIRRATGSDS